MGFKLTADEAQNKMNRNEHRKVLEVREMRNEADHGNTNNNLGFHIENYHFDSGKERLRNLFDQVLVDFLKDECADCIRPIPLLCSNGSPVDLYKLFWLVRKIGGYESVSSNNLWGVVCEECGLGLGVIASVKLIYIKYLNDLDHWLRRVFRQRVLENYYDAFIKKLDTLYWESEIMSKGQVYCIDDIIAATTNAVIEKTEYKVNGFFEGKIDADIENSYDGDVVASAAKVLENVIDRILNPEDSITAVDDDNGRIPVEDENVDNGRIPVEDENVACISAKKVVQKVIKETLDHSEKITNNEERCSEPQSLQNVLTPGTDVGDMLDSRKRKREFHNFSGTLSWLTHVARNSDDPSIGLIPECSKWSDGGDGEFWAHALQIREVLMVRRHASKSSAEGLLKDQQKKPRMHPSMYEDDIVDHRSTEKLRFSKRIPTLTKHHLCACCNSRAAPHNKETIHLDVERPPSNNNYQKSSDETEISVGPRFQAEVPEWTGLPSESDPKWLGTRMWPPNNGKGNSMDPITTRTQHVCKCPLPDSVECMRFHIAEKRLMLKQEIGSLFYRWKFHRMGEEVSLSWTEEEEYIFKDKMRSYPPYSDEFWTNSWRFLPNKTREELVSYYFNVYLVQRRSYQNRVTPKHIDSDDDEKNCGSIGGRYGHYALIVPGSRKISCVLNQQSYELV